MRQARRSAFKLFDPAHVWLGLALPILAVSPALSQQKGKDDEARDRWFSCAFGSYAVQSRQNSDKFQAAEIAMQSCKTEKQNFIRIVGGMVSPSDYSIVQGAADQIEADWKNRMTSKR